MGNRAFLSRSPRRFLDVPSGCRRLLSGGHETSAIEIA
jgi:hypothetical protein